jgi:hypothetical protein
VFDGYRRQQFGSFKDTYIYQHAIHI